MLFIYALASTVTAAFCVVSYFSSSFLNGIFKSSSLRCARGHCIGLCRIHKLGVFIVVQRVAKLQDFCTQQKAYIVLPILTAISCKMWNERWTWRMWKKKEKFMHKCCVLPLLFSDWVSKLKASSSPTNSLRRLRLQHTKGTGLKCWASDHHSLIQPSDMQ